MYLITQRKTCKQNKMPHGNYIIFSCNVQYGKCREIKIDFKDRTRNMRKRFLWYYQLSLNDVLSHS